MSSFWSGWIIILTSITIVGVTAILLGNRKGEASGDTTGHVYDGIEEYNNPLPAWWFWMFVITIVWGIGYLIMYPGMGNFKGVLGWTEVKQYEEEVAKADERYRKVRDRYLAMPIEEVAKDPIAMRMGQRMFGNNCAQCHGGDAKGSYGFPNLSDNDWLYGGDPSTIKTTITHGRQAAMPAWGAIIGDKGVDDVTTYVMSLNGGDSDTEQAKAGAKVFNTYCVACHGADAKGNPALGAPNLVNGIWLYGGDAATIAHTVRNGRNGKMPAFGEVLGEDKLHIIAAYVYSLSN